MCRNSNFDEVAGVGFSLFIIWYLEVSQHLIYEVRLWNMDSEIISLIYINDQDVLKVSLNGYIKFHLMYISDCIIYLLQICTCQDWFIGIKYIYHAATIEDAFIGWLLFKPHLVDRNIYQVFITNPTWLFPPLDIINYFQNIFFVTSDLYPETFRYFNIYVLFHWDLGKC